MAAAAGSAFAAIAIGYLLATTYLVLRDDLIGASVARQAQLQQAYEDRISALRAQVDRITSRQLLDQQLMETKVTELIARQTQLSKRHGQLGPLLDRAEGELGGAAAVHQPEPEKKDDRRAAIAQPPAGKAAVIGNLAYWSTRGAAAAELSSADKADALFSTINRSLRTIETEQMARVATLAEDADRTADAISDALETAGFRTDQETRESGIGGPYIPVDSVSMFETRVRQLDEALARLETVKKNANLLPIHNPAPGFPVSSSFGVRRDPLLGTPAMHAGMDFRVPYGDQARTSGAGTVVTAGWNAGYGRMVEVDHGQGMTTRYAHLSRILVKSGDKLDRGDAVGLVGSSGRSTGPHLHYEVRRGGVAIDPLKFIKAGRKVEQLL